MRQGGRTGGSRHGLAAAGTLVLLLVATAVRAQAPASPHPPRASAPVAASAPAAATTGRIASLRSEDYPGYGRITLDVPAGARWTLARNGETLSVRLIGARLEGSAPAPRNAVAMTALPMGLDLTMAPGGKYRASRQGHRLVLDLSNPPPGAQPGPPPQTGNQAATRKKPSPASAQESAPPSKQVSGPAPGRPSPAPSNAAPGTISLQALTGAQSGNIVSTLQAAIAATQPPPAPAAPPPATPPTALAPKAATPTGSPTGTGPTPPKESGAALKIQTAPRPPVERADKPGEPPAAAPSSAPPADSAPPSSAVPAGSAAGSGPMTLLAASEANHAVLLPFAATTGAAAFRRGDEAVLVFDERRPIDIAALRRDPLFGSAEVRLLPAATLVRLKLPQGEALSLSRRPGGWSVQTTLSPAPEPIHPLVDTSNPAMTRLRLPAKAAGHSVPVPDPLTGDTLLVGTERQAGQAVVMVQRAPEFTLLPTWLGVVVAPVADTLVLRETDDGFVLGSTEPTRGLALAPADYDSIALTDAANLTRRFDLPPLAISSLLRRLQNALSDAAAQPSGRRLRAHKTAAEAMIALGMGVEAQALLNLAVSTDPRAADDPEVIGLSAIGALIAGRDGETIGLEDPRLSGSDEISLWRALRQARLQEGSPVAAAVLASEYRLLLTYPPPLQTKMLPLAAETMVRGGETAAAQRLLDARPRDHALDYARALLAEKKGDTTTALTLLDQLSLSPDRRERARAAPQAVELRLAHNLIAKAAAADALDRLVYAWRGDNREADLRMRAADLRAEAGQPREALTLLRDGAVALPRYAPDMTGRMRAIFSAALAEDTTHPMRPLDLVTLIDENPDLLPQGDDGVALAGRLADRLAALDLPSRAASVLEKLVASASAGPVQAELGVRLALTRLQMGNAPGALSALANTDAPALPPAIQEERVLAWARAVAAQGDPARAAAALTGLSSPAALELRSRLLEKATDWRNATTTLRTLAEQTLPAQGPLTDAQSALVLRLASAAAQAGDEDTLARLRTDTLPRLPAGQNTEMVRLLTQSPVQNTADLPRARREAAFAEQVLGGGKP